MGKTVEKLELLQHMPPWEWPDEGPAWVRAGLADEEAEPRRLAVQLAPNVVDDELVDLLLRLAAEDPDEELAGAAAIALGPMLELHSFDYDYGGDRVEIDDTEVSRETFTRAVEQLRALHDDPQRPQLVRRRALEAAVRAQRPWQRDATRAALQRGDEDWRVTAVFCMGFVDGFDDEIEAALEDAAERVRCEALVAAGRRALEQAGGEAMRVAAADDASVDLRLAAIAALETLTPDGSEELLERLAGADEEEIADAATIALEERGLLEPDDELEYEV